MPREVEPSLNERQFFAKALQENIRLDGRSFDQYRALELDFGDELGVVDVRLGKTRSCIFRDNYITKLNPSLTPPQNTHPHLRPSRNALSRSPH